MRKRQGDFFVGRQFRRITHGLCFGTVLHGKTLYHALVKRNPLRLIESICIRFVEYIESLPARQRHGFACFNRQFTPCPTQLFSAALHQYQRRLVYRHTAVKQFVVLNHAADATQ